MKYRIYVDEVGNPDLQSSRDPNHRYLSLTGVIMELGYVDTVAAPALERLKRAYFGGHADEPIILHRKELVNARPPFDCLRSQQTVMRFNAELIALLSDLQYVVLTVVIDKLAHLEQYDTWHYDPYHYCMMVIVERFVRFLESMEAVGDVMAESRGGKADMRLKKSFAGLHCEGTSYVSADRIAACLTSCQLKVKLKANNIAGLQIADLIAHPSFRATLARQNKEAIADNFGGKVAAILEDSKYYRSAQGRIQGWGRKWLP